MSCLRLLCVVLTLACSYVQAAGIAVVDSRKALLESSAAKAYAAKSEKELGPMIKELQKIEEQVREQKEQFQRDSATLSEQAQKEKKKRLAEKENELKKGTYELQQKKALADQSEIQRLEPLLNEAISLVAKKHNYDAVLELSATRYLSRGLNITGQVIEQLNTLTKP